MSVRRLLLVALASALLSMSSAVCTTARVRKAWADMKANEQNLYIEAVGLGMKRGYHILFTEVHSEAQSATEAYQTCGFLYWNRRFLLAYENMLRSLGSKYECVTIPYWDYFADYSRFLLSNCVGNQSSIEACSPTLRGLGKSSGQVQNVTINGQAINGNCVSAAPGNSFCESSSISDTSRCTKCIPRSDWSSKPFPSGFGYAGLAVLLSQSNGFRQFSNSIQYGIHNSIHDALSSTMATYMAPADPIFFNHHATIDMLHQVYLECQLGAEFAPTEKLSRFAYQKCSYRYEVCPDATSNVTQRWMRDPGVTGSVPPIPVEKHPQLAAFFAPTPAKYWQLASIKSLGATQSYTYQLDSLLKNLQSNGFVCPKIGSESRQTSELDTPVDVAEASPSNESGRELQQMPSWLNWFNSFAANSWTAPTPSPSPTDSPTSAPTPTPEAEAETTSDDLTFADLSPSSGSGAATTSPQDGVDASTLVPAALASGFNDDFQAAQQERFYVEDQSEEFLASTVAAATSVDGTLQTAYEQTELIECQTHDSLVGVFDYSSFFRNSFRVDDNSHPRCFTLLNKDNKQVKVRNWRTLVSRYYHIGRRRSWNW